ncbi:TetR/AcrR family transcriptional regulator [Mycolicibacterium lutetiense]
MAFTARSEGTRIAILAAARKLLTERGFEAMTIRAVAADVGVDPTMVMRYYGNKAGLLTAAIDLDLHLDGMTPPPKKRLGETLARHFVSRWEGELADDVTTLLLRAAATNPTAAERMRTVFDTQVTTFIRRFVSDDETAPRRAGLVASQLLGLALTRYVLELPPIVAMGEEDIVADLAPVLQHYLTAVPLRTSLPR